LKADAMNAPLNPPVNGFNVMATLFGLFVSTKVSLTGSKMTLTPPYQQPGLHS